MVRVNDRARNDLKCVEGPKTELKSKQLSPLELNIERFSMCGKFFIYQLNCAVSSILYPYLTANLKMRLFVLFCF